jgi:hypothetical protein
MVYSRFRRETCILKVLTAEQKGGVNVLNLQETILKNNSIKFVYELFL